MLRDLSIGNGPLKVIVDFCTDGQLSWTDSSDWERRLAYAPDTLVTAAVYGGLIAATNFAASFWEHSLATRYMNAADRMQQAAQQVLYSREAKRFAHSIELDTGRLT